MRARHRTALLACTAAFALQAQAQSLHPLLTPPAAQRYPEELSREMQRIAGGTTAQERARQLVAALAKSLAQPREGIRTLVVPERPIAGQLSAVAIVPPSSKPGVPIGVCLQQGIVGEDGQMTHTNIGMLQIASSGSVAPHLWTGERVGAEVDGKLQAACAPYRTGYITYIQSAAPG
ncbi:MAG: hypothetical protein DI587_34045 [Variovorax paradoxus]|nr:hypothetical protein ASF45_27015 [Pseudorhodoferax sp. Leaf265]PZP91781.1 MAG: hypothetical protein DI583_34045 [Variovorax paradoxus]PZQ01791.1 MAG: hypothetical protein DI587_34045 [Variovorax paradoxus]